MSEQKQDELQRSQGQWMRPLQTAQLGNGVQPRKLSDAYAGRYTPNEPDANEAAYTAQAQATRRRRQTAAQPMTDQPAPETDAKPDAVLYSSAAGIPAAAFQDSVPGEGAAATGRRRRRMEQRQEEAPAPLPQLQPSITFSEDTLRRRAEAERQEAMRLQQEEAAAASSLREKAEAAKEAVRRSAEEEAFARQDSLRSRANAIHAAQSSQELQSAFTTNPYAAAAEPVLPEMPLREKAEAAKGNAKQKLNPFNRKGAPVSHTEDGAETPLLVNSTNKPFGLKEGLSWTLTRSDKKQPKREEAPAPDLMDSAQMPTPAPVTAIDIPKAKRTNRWLTVLVVLMLIAAAAGYLTLSGLGEDLANRAVGFYNAMTNKTVQTGTMSVVPETAAVPATLIVTLSTDSTIADLRLLDDDNNLLPADVSCVASGNDCLWSARVVMDKPYTGFIRAQLLDMKGEWVIGSSSRYVNID